MNAGDEGDRLETERRLERIAWVLDNSIPVPLTGRRIGIESLIGLVPVVGDLAGGVLSAYIIAQGARLGVGVTTLLRMLGNVVLETLLGLVPLVGDLFDMGFKSNTRNVRLLHDYLERPDAVVRRSRLTVAAVVTAVLAVIVLLLAVALWLGRALWRAISGLFWP